MPNDMTPDQMGFGPIHCSFCGKTQDQVRKLVKGPSNIFICDECVAACSEILEESLAQDFLAAQQQMPFPPDTMGYGAAVEPEREEPDTAHVASSLIKRVPTPHEIYDELSAYVMGQEDAKRAMSVAVYNHYRRVLEGEPPRAHTTRAVAPRPWNRSASTLLPQTTLLPWSLRSRTSSCSVPRVRARHSWRRRSRASSRCRSPSPTPPRSPRRAT